MRTPDRARGWMPLLIVAAGLMAYANTFRAPFIFDDWKVIVGNPEISRLSVPLGSRWVVDLTFRLNYALHGFNVAGYHLVNLLIHLCTGLLLFGVVRRTVERMVHGLWFMVGRGETSRVASQTINHSSHEARRATWDQPSTIALLAALLWVVHPLNTQAVTYITQRYESLMGLCFLLTLYCFVRGLQAVRPRRWFNGAIVACAMGMGTKEVMVVAPVLLLLYDWVFEVGGVPALRVRWRVHAALFATWGFLAVFQLGFVSAMLASPEPVSRVAAVSRLEYLLTQSAVITHYLRLSVIPVGMCLDHAWRIAGSVVDVWAELLLLIGLGVATLWALRKRSACGYLGVWFFLVLAPTSSIIPISDMAFEHRMYVPLMAVVTAGVGAVAWGVRRRTSVGVVAGVVVALLMIGLTLARNAQYGSAERIWRVTVLQSPRNRRAHLQLADALAGEGRWTDAEVVVTNLLTMLPDYSLASDTQVADAVWMSEHEGRFSADIYSGAQNTLGVCLAADTQRATNAMMHFREAVRLSPRMIEARLNVAAQLYQMGRLDEAAAEWRRIRQLDPQNDVARQALAVAEKRTTPPADADGVIR